ncbi:MAG TPA: hypothetical protein VLC98_02740 [Phnomibacter sp.]|nr:hypothetical protein [Phnomibacter sp.]
MKFGLLGLVLCFFSSLRAQQHMQVLLRNGEPAIGYSLKPNESSVDVYRKFGMSDSLFMRLNQHDSTQKYDDNIIYLAVKGNMHHTCNTGPCTELFYLAAAGDNFKSIGGHFVNLSPFAVKELNPMLESVAVGDPVLVGYLPTGLLNNGSVAVAAQSAPASPTKLYKGTGIYADDYRQEDTTSFRGKASNFKSLAAWYDGKYYCLSNDVGVGTVVKITNTQNGLFVYAKVLGPMPVIKGEKSLITRLCNAACAMLDIWDDNDFDVRIEK